jgi:hypothetical protein
MAFRRSRTGITDGKYLIFYSQPHSGLPHCGLPHSGLPALNVKTDDESFAIMSP